LGYKTYTKLYDACVATIMDYGSSVWGYKNYNASNSVHNRAMRYYLGVHKFAPIPGMEGDMNWLQPQTRWKHNIIWLWNRLLNTNPNRLVYKIFEYDHHCYTNDLVNNWSKYVHDILIELNLEDKFVNKGMCVMPHIDSMLKLSSEESWRQRVLSKPKLRTYSKLKNELTFEPYLTANLPRYDRSLLAQIRLGILPLRIETGRFVREKLEDRICQFCDLNEVEDEYHFVFRCPTYNHEREQLLHTAHFRTNNWLNASLDSKLKILFQSEHVYRLGLYVKSAYSKRRSILYK